MLKCNNVLRRVRILKFTAMQFPPKCSLYIGTNIFHNTLFRNTTIVHLSCSRSSLISIKKQGVKLFYIIKSYCVGTLQITNHWIHLRAVRYQELKIHLWPCNRLKDNAVSEDAVTVVRQVALLSAEQIWYNDSEE